MPPNIRDSFYCIPPKNTYPRKALLVTVLLSARGFFCFVFFLLLQPKTLLACRFVIYPPTQKWTLRMVCQLITHSPSYFEEIATEPRFNEVTGKLTNGFNTLRCFADRSSSKIYPPLLSKR